MPGQGKEVWPSRQINHGLMQQIIANINPDLTKHESQSKHQSKKGLEIKAKKQRNCNNG